MQPVKSKVMVYLLICAVAMVWGIILHKVFFKHEEESFSVELRPKAPLVAYNRYETKPDTFNLVLSYRDPFLNKPAQKDNVNDVKEKTAFVPVTWAGTSPKVVWPEIKYNGRIVNPRSKKAVAIMSVDGAERMIEEGQTFGGVKLVKNRPDSILIQWNGLKKYIKQ
jgi:hypothetical protein